MNSNSPLSILHAVYARGFTAGQKNVENQD